MAAPGRIYVLANLHKKSAANLCKITTCNLSRNGVYFNYSKGKEVTRMEVTAQEMKVLKMNLLGGMNSYIMAMNDEVVLKKWQARILPENCTEEDLEKIATNDEMWVCACSTFGRLTKGYQK